MRLSMLLDTYWPIMEKGLSDDYSSRNRRKDNKSF